jgi:colanic acid/amylovoran biosynthesis glycosyltransferase
VYGEARVLLARGHALRVLAMASRADGAANPDLPRWTLDRPPRFPIRLALAPEAMSWLAKYQRRRSVARAMWAAATMEDGEGIHVHFAGVAGEWAHAIHLARGTPYTLTVHAVDLFKPRPALPEVLAAARRVLTVSRYNAGVLRERYGVEADLVRCGVDPAVWPVARPEHGRWAVAVGRWVPKKGLDLAVKACERLGIPLRLFSDAPRGVKSDGLQPQSAIAKALSEAAFFVLPCREARDGDRDGIPVALMEAMVSGVPVITTNLPGLGELVDESCGWLVPPDDLAALESTMKFAWTHPEERARRGARAREEILRGWTLDRQADGVERAWGVTTNP